MTSMPGSVRTHQWRNRRGWGGVGGGGRVPPSPPRLLTGKFLMTYREKRSKEKKSENWEERKENCEREGGKIQNGRWKSYKCCFFSPLLFFKTTKICFGSTKMEKHFTMGNNQEKWLCPLIKSSSYAPDAHYGLFRACAFETPTTSFAGA